METTARDHTSSPVATLERCKRALNMVAHSRKPSAAGCPDRGRAPHSRRGTNQTQKQTND